MRAALAALAALLSATPLAAQAVQGRLVQPDGAPVAQTLVSLVDSAGRSVGTALTDRQGGFTLRAPAPGRFTLRAERVGYALTESPAFRLAAGETVQQRLVSNDRRASLAGIVAGGAARAGPPGPGGGGEHPAGGGGAPEGRRAGAHGPRGRP